MEEKSPPAPPPDSSLPADRSAAGSGGDITAVKENGGEGKEIKIPTPPDNSPPSTLSSPQGKVEDGQQELKDKVLRD